MTTRYFVPCCLLERHSVKLTKLLENRFTFSTYRTTPWKLIRSHAVTPRWLDDASNQGGANSVTVLSLRNPGCGCWSLRKLHFSKIIRRLALGFSMDLRLNTMRRSINLSVCLVFDLEAGQFKFLGENLLGAGVLENELSTLVSFL